MSLSLNILVTKINELTAEQKTFRVGEIIWVTLNHFTNPPRFKMQFTQRRRGSRKERKEIQTEEQKNIEQRNRRSLSWRHLLGYSKHFATRSPFKMQFTQRRKGSRKERKGFLVFP
jgi:hypothetical protein